MTKHLHKAPFIQTPWLSLTTRQPSLRLCKTQMFYRAAADLLLLFHLLFILFVVLGGLLTIINKRWAFLHLPAVIWGAALEFKGCICPLTPLENQLRNLAGQHGYAGGFLQHYLLPVIYPGGLTHKIQYLLGSFVIAINLMVYFFVFKSYKTQKE